VPNSDVIPGKRTSLNSTGSEIYPSLKLSVLLAVNLLHISAIFREVFNEEKYINGWL
jgi:hypothetical protein